MRGVRTDSSGGGVGVAVFVVAFVVAVVAEHRRSIAARSRAVVEIGGTQMLI
jgi:hypothetical protein